MDAASGVEFYTTDSDQAAAAKIDQWLDLVMERLPGARRQDRPARIYLSPPHMSGTEQRFVQEAFETNWIAPVGPHVDAFEREFAQAVGSPHAAAVTSGTAALHLALMLVGVEPGDEVFVSTLTFAASVNPIVYLGAKPVFVDSEPGSWNMDPVLLEQALGARSRAGRLPKAVVVVHLYGQSADMDPILAACDRYGVTVIEDAAEALGATYKGRSPGTLGRMGIFSFNGNKIITTSGGGMLVAPDGDLIAQARKLATQARDPVPHYEHSEVGYNYRMSNVLAGIGRGQLRVLDDRVAARRRNFEAYVRGLEDVPGIRFMPEAPWGRHTRWLTCITVDPEAFGADCEQLRVALGDANIEARPVWKPMHLQPVFREFERVGGSVAESLFASGLCLPSGSSLTSEDLTRVIKTIRTVRPAASPRPAHRNTGYHGGPPARHTAFAPAISGTDAGAAGAVCIAPAGIANMPAQAGQRTNDASGRVPAWVRPAVSTLAAAATAAATVIAATALGAVTLSIHTCKAFIPLALIAVVFNTRSFGRWAGLLASLLAAIAEAYVFLPPDYSLAVGAASDRFGLVLFTLSACAVAVLIQPRSQFSEENRAHHIRCRHA